MSSFDNIPSSIRVPPPLQGLWGPPGTPNYQPQPHPYQGASYQTFNPSEMRSAYSLCISGVVPRPIALTSTLSADGVRNVAPFSYFNIMSHDPPHVTIGICKNPDGTSKDTLRNIEETKEFVINIMSDWYVESANHCCGDFTYEEDEVTRSGLTPLPSDVVKPCRIAESGFHMECKLVSTTDIVNDSGKHTTTIVLGRVHRFHVLEPLMEEGSRGQPQVKYEGLRPVGRIGGSDYVYGGNYFEILRPKIQK